MPLPAIKDKMKYLNDFRVRDDKSISLKDFDTDYDHKNLTKEEGEELLKLGIDKLAEMQGMLYAQSKYSLLIVFQAMDAAGKDGCIKHVMSGLNPQGVKVTSFKVPTPIELAHDFLWRHYLALPKKGEIGIFNRSHYENVLVTRVHPEFILAENIPGIRTVNDINQDFWDRRFKEINHFEKMLSDNGTTILKFFLHISKKEQKKRFLERIDDPSKNWKFSQADVKERGFWKDYRKAYEDMLSNTSKDCAPWYVIPADDKWFTHLSIAAIIADAMEQMKLAFPTIDAQQKAALEKSKQDLLNEGSGKKDAVAAGEEGSEER